MTNPLGSYLRTPKLYVKLPSGLEFYEPDSISTSINGEVAVYPLTSIDQIMLKTPDALLNGEAMLRVFASCVPGVQDVSQLVEPDINLLMVAIRVASSGPSIEINATCPSCGHENTFDLDLQSILDTATPCAADNAVEIDGQLMVHVRPYNFKQRNLQMLNEIQQAQTAAQLNASSQVEDNARIGEVSQNFIKMAHRTFDLLAMSITGITVLKTGEHVTDPAYITEWIKGIPNTTARLIIDRIRELNESGIDGNLDFKCTKCNHEWQQRLDLDPTSFFD